MGLLAALIVNLFGGAVIYLTGGLGLPWVAGLLGFGNLGIAAGSTAAAAQAYYGNLVAGSVISQLTAAAMVAPTLIMGLLAAIAVNVIGGAVIYGTGGLGAGLVAPLLGFGSVGIGAGTTAAAAQAYYGNLAAGSIISQLTAAAMVAPTP